jgi:hypothetical protein
LATNAIRLFPDHRTCLIASQWHNNYTSTFD